MGQLRWTRPAPAAADRAARDAAMRGMSHEQHARAWTPDAPSFGQVQPPEESFPRFYKSHLVTSRNFKGCYNLRNYKILKTFYVEVPVATNIQGILLFFPKFLDFEI